MDKIKYDFNNSSIVFHSTSEDYIINLLADT